MICQWLRKDEHGFTLVELMMVIVILGVLAGVAVPLTAGLRRNAAKAKLDAYADSWAQAIMIGAIADGKVPDASDEVTELLEISDTELKHGADACKNAENYCLQYTKTDDAKFVISTWDKGADSAFKEKDYKISF